MLRELIALFSSEKQGNRIAGDLNEMIRQSAQVVRLAGDIYFRRTSQVPSAEAVKQQDKSINKLQRQLRKEALGEVVGDPTKVSLPFSLSVMNVVKDVERIGDYAKDLAELAEQAGPAQWTAEAAQVAEPAERFLDRLTKAMEENDQIKAVHLIDLGKDIRRDLNAIQRDLLAPERSAPHTATETLAVQFYIRIVSHGLNVLSTLVTPLHRMDYLGKKDLLPEVKQRLEQLTTGDEADS
jgi:phosphate transport system protein